MAVVFIGCDDDETKTDDLQASEIGLNLSTALTGSNLTQENGTGVYWNETYNLDPDVKYTSGYFTFSHTADYYPPTGTMDEYWYWDGFVPSTINDITFYQTGTAWAKNQWGCMEAATLSSSSSLNPFLVCYWSSYSDAKTGPVANDAFSESTYHLWVRFNKDNDIKSFAADEISVAFHPWTYYNVTETDPQGITRPLNQPKDSLTINIYGVKDNKFTGRSVIHPLVHVDKGIKAEDSRAFQSVDISALGEVDYIVFQMSSSATNDWGITTATYFCLRDFYIIGNPE
ncbi:MAG: DUF4465 domain-containing protein [Bacteroides sp.]|nr:DUF4465 domain-containing protein [Bacteroides sp.]